MRPPVLSTPPRSAPQTFTHTACLQAEWDAIQNEWQENPKLRPDHGQLGEQSPFLHAQTSPLLVPTPHFSQAPPPPLAADLGAAASPAPQLPPPQHFPEFVFVPDAETQVHVSMGQVLRCRLLGTSCLMTICHNQGGMRGMSKGLGSTVALTLKPKALQIPTQN